MFCEHCGQQIESSAKFCEYCGAKIVSASAPTYPPEPAPEAPYSDPNPSYGAPETPGGPGGEPDPFYSEPETPSYSQPGSSYSRPGASYSQPGASSYSQPGASAYGDPGASYDEPGRTYSAQERRSGFSVSAKPEVRILGIPVRGPAMWIALGVLAVIVLAVVLIAKLGGGRETVEDEPPQTFEAVESTPEPTPEPGPSMAEIAGLYRLVQMSTEEDGDLNGELEMMASMGLVATLELSPDGTGTMDAYGEYEESFTWDENGITIDGEIGSYTYENGTITLAQDGEVMVFQRTTYAELRALAEAAQAVSEPAGTVDASLAGDYYATACLYEGEDVGADEDYLHLEADGTGYIWYVDDLYEFEWELDGGSFYFIDESGDEFYGVYNDGVIEGEYFETLYYVFDRNAAAGGISARSSGSAAYDPDKFDTDDTPTLADFQWLTYDVAHGGRPSNAEWLTDFEEVRGGWKCYLIDDPDGEYGTMMEFLLNAYIDGTADAADVTFDWYYAYDGSQDQGYEDNASDSSFSGSWTNGILSGVGSGRITLTDFWYADGHEYGMGILMWQDGATSLVALARP